MLATRIAKIALLALIAFYFLIVVLNNTIFDYPANYGFVQHVLSMDTLFSGESQRWRAFPDPTPEDNSYWLHHAFYWSVIAWEALTGMLCGFGSIRLARQLKAPARAFNASKSLAIYGLTLSLLQWFAAFLTVDSAMSVAGKFRHRFGLEHVHSERRFPMRYLRFCIIREIIDDTQNRGAIHA